MADKQLTMPTGLLPSWANDLNINDPGEPWDATPTKVNPGSGKRDDGHLPEENPPAQHENFRENLISRWIQYFSTLSVTNWVDLGPPNDEGQVQRIHTDRVIYDEGLPGWITAGLGRQITTSGDGSTWVWLQFVPGSVNGSYKALATKPPTDTPTHTGINIVGSTYSTLGSAAIDEVLTGGQTSHALPGVNFTGVKDIIWDASNQRWIFVGGEDNGGTPVPALWTAPAPMGGAPTQRAAAVVNSTFAETVAVSPAGLSVAVGDAAPFDVWTSSDAITFNRSTPTGITAGQIAKSILWVPGAAAFVLLTDQEVYKSTDGVSWSQISVVAGTADPFQIRCLATDGGGIMIAAGDLSVTGLVHIRYSLDQGVTWRMVVVPPAEMIENGVPGGGGTIGGGRQPIASVAYSRLARRFMIEWHPFSTAWGNVAISLSAGGIELDPDLTLNVPQVT